jgi:hypothetical protein
MADKELSEITEANALTGSEITYVVQSGNSRRSTVNAQRMAATDANVRAATSGKTLDTGLLSSAAVGVALTDAAPVTVNWTAAINFTLTVTAARQVDNPSNGIPGTWRTILVQGNSGTARTITFGNQFLGNVPSITDCTSSTWYLIMIYCVSATHFVASVKQAK